MQASSPMLLKTHGEKKSVLCLAKILMKIKGIHHSCQDVDEKKGTYEDVGKFSIADWRWSFDLNRPWTMENGPFPSTQNPLPGTFLRLPNTYPLSPSRGQSFNGGNLQKHRNDPTVADHFLVFILGTDVK